MRACNLSYALKCGKMHRNTRTTKGGGLRATHRARLQEIVDVVFGGNEKAAAEAAGVQQSTMHRILSGNIANPTVSTLQKMADAFGQPIGWFTGELDELPSEQRGRAGPRWFHLLWDHHRRATRSEREWILNADTVTPEQKAVQDEYKAISTKAAMKLWYACQPRWAIHGKSDPQHPGPPSAREVRVQREEFAPVLRDLLKADAALTTMAFRRLKQLGVKGRSGD